MVVYIVVGTLDLRLSVVGSVSSNDTVPDGWPFAGKLSWDITNTYGDLALHAPVSLNRVPASGGVKTEKSPLP